MVLFGIDTCYIGQSRYGMNSTLKESSLSRVKLILEAHVMPQSQFLIHREAVMLQFSPDYCAL